MYDEQTLQQKVSEARAKGVDEATIQARVNELRSQNQIIPTTTPAPKVSANPVPQESLGTKIGNGIVNIGKSIVKPFVETGKNIGAAAIQMPSMMTQGTLTEAIANPKTPEWERVILQKELDLMGKYTPQFKSDTELSNISADPEKAIRQQVGNSAQMASWAVPYGKASFVGSKFIVPGAIQGAAQAGGRTMAQEDTTLPEIIGNTVVGGVVGAGTGAVLQGLGWVYGKVANKLSGASSKVEAGITGAKPKSTDINYVKDQEEMNAVADKYLGVGSAKDKLTKLPEAMGSIDKTIRVALKGSENTPVNTNEIATKFLDDFSKNSSVAADDPLFAKAGEQIQKRLESLGTNPSPEAIYNLKSELSGELSPAFRKIGLGNPLTPIEEAKISMWGSLKDSLDNISPKIRALNNDQHILSSLPKGLVKSMEKAGPKIPLPGTFKGIPLPVSNETVQSAQSGAGKFLSGTGNLMNTGAAALPDIVNQSVPKIATAATTGSIGAPSEPGLPSITETPPTTPETSQGDFITGHSPEEIYQAMQKAQAAGDTRAESDLRQMYNDENAYQKANPNSKMAVNTNARDAMVALNAVESALIKPDGSVNMGQVYESAISPLGHKYEADLNSLMIKFIQSQTSSGRLPSKEQMKMFKEAYAPRINDSPEAIKAKLANLRNAIENAKYTKPTADTLPDITAP